MVNKVILIGNLGQDPEMRYTSNGTPVANFSLATNEKYSTGDGQMQERTEWHRVVVFGRTAENCANYLAKGRQAYVEGRLQTRQWEDRDGNRRYTTEIVAREVRFLGGGGRGEQAPPPRDEQSGYQRSESRGSGGGSYSEELPPRRQEPEDDIPF
jgi:single-strand DNA-binding protein